MIQSPPSRANLLRLSIPAGLILALAVAFGWSAGDVVVPRTAAPPLTRWSLPRPRVEDRARDLRVVIAGRPWERGDTGITGSARTQPQASSAPANWRLAGIAKRGDQSFALIVKGINAKEQIDYLRVGERLPDSSVIVAVAADSIVTTGGKQSSARKIYRLFHAKE